MNTLSNNAYQQPNESADFEYELCSLTKKYETQGFIHHFYLENGLLVCGDNNQVLNKPAITIHESGYYPKRQGMPHGFCYYAILVRHAFCIYKGILLLPQGFLAAGEVSTDVDHQLQLHHWYPQIFKVADKSVG